MKTLFLYLLMFLVASIQAFSGCTKMDTPEGTPRCIKNKIKKEKTDCLVGVYEYEYVGKKVYYFNFNCPDALHYVYDDQCNLVCCPSGGISGGGDGKCSDFYQSSKNKKIIWQK